jgi:hypothetical protein
MRGGIGLPSVGIFLLTPLLLDHLKTSEQGRIIRRSCGD